ncbi:MAG: SDR family NAD(P)-dependent oxidoreductase, partial [Desulfobulbaceae bacterium]|nr:SDR family NAD(P)-dependent oxidoreductase [Desulfobulbaceae bacterium]
ETLIQFASFRGQAMAAPAKESGTMASLSCPVETAAEIINSIDGYAVVANINSPKQTVISGDNQCISEAVKLAKDRGITTHILPVSNAFHSKYAQKAADLLRTKAPIPQTADHFKIKLFSCMNGKEILPSHNLPDHFADQALSPVDFISLIASMAGECDLMVEVGPGKVLTNLTHAIIHEKTPVCLPIEAKPGHDRDLNTFLGKYFIRGGAIHFEALYEDRLIRPFVPAAQRSFIENPCERPFDATIAQEQITPEVAEMIDSTLAKAIDISPRELTEYLSIRSNFLETIIKGDIGNLPLYQAAADLLPETEEKRIITSAQPPAPHHEKSPETKTESTDTGTEILYALLEKITGFPAQSLTLDLRLLDDLNLDSIKAGDLIAKFSQELGVGGQVDPAAMANATLAEIINTIGELAAGDMVNKDQETVVETDWNTDSILSIVKQGVAALIGRPVESFQAEARSGPDLKMSLEHLAELLHHISKELKAELNLDLPPLLDRTLTQLAVIVGRLLHNRLARQTPPQTIEHRPWVREIHAELVQTPAPLSELYQGKRYEDNWRHAQVLLLNSEATGEVADVLKSLLNSLGAEVTLQEYYKGFDPDAVKNASLYSHLIIVLPQEAGEPVAADGQLEEMISRLASIASPPHAATAPRRRTTVAYIQFGGGSFGMHSTAGYLNTCCASALAKSLHLERDDLRVRVLDFDPKAAPAAIAEKITFEMHTVDDFAAVGYDRSLVRRELKQHLLQPADYRNRSFSWTQEDVILVTGGAKGITAACALGLAKETGARMALLGRTPHSHDQPDADIAETLKKYEEAGCSAQYFSCDVSDQTSVHDVVQKIRANMGPITGVIHGAGLNVPRLVNQVSVQEALQEVSPKILGILNLMTELKDTPPRLLVGLSSIIGVTGMPGNGWYGFSNEALDILLHRIEADFPQTKTLSVAYSIWQEEGMGARMGSVKALKQKGIDAIPTEEGVKRFVRLFIKDPGVPQVIIAARLSGLNTFQWQTEIPEPQGRFLEKPLHITPGVESVFQTHLSLETDTYLKDHVFNGSYLFPTVFGLEAMAQAVAHVTGQNDFSRIRIENIQLKRPITVDPESGADIVVWAELIESETPSDVQTVEAGVYKQGSGPKLGFFKATFVLGLEHEHVTYKINLPENPLDIVPKEDLYNGRLLFQGPQFQRLQEIYSLDSKQCIFNTAFKPSDVNNKEQQWLLGDPFFRDSLLHS